MRDNGTMGCLAAIGLVVLLVFGLSMGWGLVVSGGPILGGLLLVGVFFLGYVLGGQR